MEILKDPSIEKGYKVSFDPCLENLDIRRNGKPHLGHILDAWGFDSDLVEPLSELAKNSNLRLTGGTARKILGYEIPDIEPPDFFLNPVQAVTGISDYKIWEKVTAARVIRKVQRTDFDLDLLTDLPINHLNILFVARRSHLFYEKKSNPNRMIIGNHWSEGLKISITQMPSENAKHSPPCTTLDEIAFKIDGSLKINIDQKFKEEDLTLGIVGFDKLVDSPESKRSQRIAINFITESLTEKHGKRINVDFGESEDDEKIFLNWLFESAAQVIAENGLNGHSLFTYNPYIRLLNVVQANWDFLDPKIQKVIIKAFEVNY